MSLTRRQFIRGLGWAAAAVAAGAVYPTLIEPRRVQVEQVHLALPNLPPAWDGLRIVQLSDLHRSRYVGARYLAKCVERANALEPDLFALTGDYLTSVNHFGPLGWAIVGSRAAQAGWAASVADCLRRARARHGVFACLGNQDNWFDGDIVANRLRAVGIAVLRNTHTTVNIRGRSLAVVGLGDYWTEGVKVNRAFGRLDLPVALVLMHNPDFFPLWRRPGTNVILAGHTHGGQVTLPWLGTPLVPSMFGRKYVRGLFRRGDTWMYVNRGLGVVAPPVRLNCPPEITLIHLHCA
jgi:predicted MPP superfamily phosphohydrolase